MCFKYISLAITLIFLLSSCHYGKTIKKTESDDLALIDKDELRIITSHSKGLREDKDIIVDSIDFKNSPRKILYVDRSKLAQLSNGVKEGEKKQISIITCVNRNGKVTYVEIDKENTDVTNISVLKDALQLVSGYEFEPDVTAPKETCAKVKIFIDKTDDLK